MDIDWLTVAAQIVNFLVLVWLLQRFLYRPIQTAMAEREARIATRLSQARAARETAEDEARDLRTTREELAADRERILDAARREADDLRRELEQDVREDIERRRAAWLEHIEDEREAFAMSLRRRAGHQVIAIAAQVVRDYADADLAAHVAGTFAARLAGLDDAGRDRLAKAAAREGVQARVESGVPLDANARRQVTRAIHERLGTAIEVVYEEDEEVLLGLRLSIGEQTVEWSAARYFQALEATLDDVLEETVDRPAAGPGDAP